MSPLPGFSKVALVVSLLITYHLSLITPSYAVDAPNPQPCEDALSTNQYTKVVLEPKEFTFTATANDGDLISLSHTFDVQIDFSKLAAIFAASNSNYLESDFQSDSHRTNGITDLGSQDFNSYHGAGQKAAPIVVLDDLRVKYVNYIYEHPGLPESSNTYTDLDGAGPPKKIYDMVNEYGRPIPPEPTEDMTTWQNTWGHYWEKIPTAVNEYYYGILRFLQVVGNQELDAVKKGGCPPKPFRSIYFVMPNYFRTTSLSNELNQIMVPKAAQSSSSDFVEKTLFAKAIDNTKSAFADLAQTCLSIFPDSPFKDSLKKTIKISLEFLSPIKNAYAAPTPGSRIPPGSFQDPCPAPIPILPNDKKGQGPFCSLPVKNPETNEPQLQAGENCSNVNSPLKEDKGQLVKCNFRVSFSSQRPINGPGNTWDSCQQQPDGRFQCSLTIRVFPTFYIPWLATIWNNTTYSDKADQIAVLNNAQETGKPGFYPFFIPGAVDESAFADGKNLPSKEQQSTDQIKQRFFGGTQNGQDFDKNCALMPQALRDYLNIQTCDNLK